MGGEPVAVKEDYLDYSWDDPHLKPSHARCDGSVLGSAAISAPLPPPPPFTSELQPLHIPHSFPPQRPPPPPPAPPHSESEFIPDKKVETPNEFIPKQYADESIHCIKSQLIRIVPWRRNVLVTRHQATATEYKEYEWLLRFGSTEIWYEKPTRAFLRMENVDSNHCTPELLSVVQAMPVRLETPTVWASAPMTTALDNNVCNCAAGRSKKHGCTGICGECTDEQGEALEDTSLAYYLILSTCQAREPFLHGPHSNGHKIYSMIRCGSRDAAVAEAFYASGVNGWNVAFSCVMRLGEDFEQRSGKAKVVKDLAQLAQDDEDEENVRVFY
ncbi:hypothetical protein DDE82_009097 [Stemphylium lycopersici]|uniref:Uncharacterized protein n=1 Tax=Stemphylium lycopersici TaxID=183478 RepID=A0A364MR82_STELY|nr:hypothetical protein TW65_09162 [Stemphylium lycopersici]RAQ98598.1 hypothetical protein DDE82_009097 [Stemphylium lycopersici]RAQ99707.1 hypothetical protein DDE83_009182 [Stemphylium lycopersici]